MKIKEKGIDPSKAYNFNAFNKRERKPKPADAMDEDALVGRDVFLEFMGQKLLIRKDAAGEGYVEEAELEMEMAEVEAEVETRTTATEAALGKTEIRHNKLIIIVSVVMIKKCYA